jgi:hypothetical protein
VRNALCDWLDWMQLVRAGESGAIDRYIGYYKPYAVSHDELDRDEAVQEETRNAARSLVETIKRIRNGEDLRPDKGLVPPRRK